MAAFFGVPALVAPLGGLLCPARVVVLQVGLLCVQC